MDYVHDAFSMDVLYDWRREIDAVPSASRFCEFLQAARSTFLGAVAVLATAISRVELKKLTLSDSQATKLSNARQLMVEGTMAIA